MCWRWPPTQIDNKKGHYDGKKAVLTTKHEKSDAFSRPLLAGLGLTLDVAELDTDQLGTFTDEIRRRGTPLETAIKKARLGMHKNGSSLGLANEGSFGPHPDIPFAAGCCEIIAFLDDDLGIEIVESLISTDTNYAHISVGSIEEVENFLLKVKFPSHGLIVQPEIFEQGLIVNLGRAFLSKFGRTIIQKGIKDKESLILAIRNCKRYSKNGLVRIETDMRAHMNPTRMRVLRLLAIKFARRLRCVCPICQCPGFGLTKAEGFLVCAVCSYPSIASAFELHSCARCGYSKKMPRSDGMTQVEAKYCQICNP